MAVKHSKMCAAYVNVRGRCTCNAKFNGLPFSHWQAMAERLVVDLLVRAVNGYNHDLAALPQQIAYQIVMELANNLSSETVQEVLAERDRFMAAVGAMHGGQR